jgi:transcriptional regulator with XRE-family HTH domain
MDKENYYKTESIGNRLATFRKKAGFTQSELAMKLGVSRSLIAEYERDRRRLYDKVLIKLAKILNVSSDKILGLKKDMDYEHKPSLRFIKRLKKIEELPEVRKKEILRTLDDLIYASEKK